MRERIDRQRIERAAERIAGYVRATPTIEVDLHGTSRDGAVVLKLEQLQHTGSFKPRGVFNRALSSEVPDAGLVAASGGNHGAAVAFAARRLGQRAEIYIPETAPEPKAERIRAYGAVVRRVGRDYAAAESACRRRAAETGALSIHAYDQPEVVAGQGTVARELEAQEEGLDAVLVAVGGGGLIGGIATWFGDAARVIGVESRGSPTLARARQAGRPVDVEIGGLAADALGARCLGRIAFDVAERHVDGAVLVSPEAIREARRWLWDELRLLVEPGGATALAALRSGIYDPEAGEKVAVVICGANTDVEL